MTVAKKCTLSAIKWQIPPVKKQISVSPNSKMSSVVPSFYILRLGRLFSDIVGNEKLSQTKRILSITVASDPVSLHYATIGAFVISENLARFSPYGVEEEMKQMSYVL